MKAKKESVVYGIIGLLIGSLITVVVASNAVNNNYMPMMQMMGINTNRSQMIGEDENVNKKGHMMPNGSMMDEEMDNSMSMNDMVSSLKDKTGDEFDKAFLSGMIEHHQGAIDMANLVKQYAKHDEIKSMAGDIISAQTKEIDEMRQWYQAWGY